MGKLITCRECGSKVSSSASNCPRCSTRYIKGVSCSDCYKTLKQSEAIDFKNSNIFMGSGYYHSSCLTKLADKVDKVKEKVNSKLFDFRCPACRKKIDRWYKECPTCNEYFLIDKCAICKQQLYAHALSTINKPERVSMGISDDTYLKDIYYHSDCYNFRESKRTRSKYQEEEKEFDVGVVILTILVLMLYALGIYIGFHGNIAGGILVFAMGVALGKLAGL